METAGIEPASAIAQKTVSTSVAGALDLAPRSPSPAGFRGASPSEMSPLSAQALLQGVILLSDSALIPAQAPGAKLPLPSFG